MKSKVIHWGHTLTAALFACAGLDALWHAILHIPGWFHQSPGEITYYVVSDAFFWVLLLICAWGIYNWRGWSRPLGIVLSIFELGGVVIAFLVFVQTKAGLGRGWVLSVFVSSLPLIWLLLPAVRQEYSRRNQPA
ncbi:MAG: hypothetical protein ACRD5R_12535 [Candidatus Acidiferrales bacterium]